MLMAFFNGYSARVVEVFVNAKSNLLCADWSLEGSNRPGRGQDEKTDPEPTNQPFILGLADEILGLRAPLFYLAPRYDPPGSSFELEEIVVRWPMAYGSKSTIERKQNAYAKICRTRRSQTVH